MQDVILDDLPHHPAAEVGHVGLVEGDVGAAGEVLGELAREHAAVGGVVLLRDLLHHHHLRMGKMRLSDSDRLKGFRPETKRDFL